MSADNWAECPACSQKRERKIRDEEARVSSLYGVAPFEEFDAARQNLEKMRLVKIEHTFREDYEVYDAETGLVKFTYTGRCTVCKATANMSCEAVVCCERRASDG